MQDQARNLHVSLRSVLSLECLGLILAGAGGWPYGGDFRMLSTVGVMLVHGHPIILRRDVVLVGFRSRRMLGSVVLLTINFM
jgi:hypothetical protein